jgi:hypothetical protein
LSYCHKTLENFHGISKSFLRLSCCHIPTDKPSKSSSWIIQCHKQLDSPYVKLKINFKLWLMLHTSTESVCASWINQSQTENNMELCLWIDRCHKWMDFNFEPCLWLRLVLPKGPNRYVSPSSHLKTDKEQFSETLHFLVTWISGECYKPSSEPFGYYQKVSAHLDRRCGGGLEYFHRNPCES